MAEYFIPTFLDETGRITRALHPADYGMDPDVWIHTRAGNPLLTAVEILLALDGGSRLVWAGDYADPEAGHGANLYQLSQPAQFVRIAGLVEQHITPNTPRPPIDVDAHTYVCNADRREYFDRTALPMDDYERHRSLLPALTHHGHGRPGSWARNRIFVTATRPDSDWTRVPHLLFW